MSTRAKAAALAFALLAGGWMFATRGALRPNAFGYDFVAFYCASSVALGRADPYRTEPLRTCEHRAGRQFRADSKLVVPAPLPGYVLLLLTPFASLPYPLALVLWTLLSLAAYAICVVTLVRFSGLSPPLVVASTALSLGFVSLFLGQLVPLALAALCLAARALERERWWSAAGWFALAAVEPQLALPAIVAVAIARPGARIPLCAAVAVLAAISLATLGVAENIEYFARVVPAQVAAEIVRADQLSPVAIAYRIGLGVAAAVKLGSVTYGLALALGVALGIGVARRTGLPAALAFVPPAVALCGAPYIHIHHLAVALPAALLLAGRTPWRTPALIALFALCVPWIVPYDATPYAPFAALCVAVLACGFLRISPARGALLGLVTALLVLVVQASLVTPVPPPPSAYAGIAGSDLAQSGWNVLVGATLRGNATVLTLLAIPAWTALAALVFAAFGARRGAAAPA